MRKLYVSALLIFLFNDVYGQFSLTVPNYTQDFNTLASAGTSSTLPTGWAFLEQLANANTTYTAGNGGSATGDTYSFGTAAGDRALGGLQSGNLNPFIGFYFTNNTGSTITSLAISYIGEQWRLGATGRSADTLNFQYSTNATSLTSGSWTDEDALDFITVRLTAPTGAVDGNTTAYRASRIHTISGLSIPNGSSFFIRWTDSDIAGAEDGLSIDDFSLTADFTVPSTDHFRSVATGNWNSLATWESSPDNTTWVAATSLPTSTANTITIRNGHVVTITASASADQLTIQNGATLTFSAGTFTIDNGTADDIVIENGGVFHLAQANTPPVFSAIAATARVSMGAILRVSAGGMTGAGTGVNATNYIYEHASILEWAASGVSTFSTAGVTYFPNVDGITTPIFRTTNATPITVGAGTATVFNGVFECNGAAINWQNAGTKTFRNGIRGTGNMDGFSLGTSGMFIIDGFNAELGGSGSLLTPMTGLNIGGGTGTIVTVTANKIISGGIVLLANSYVRLGNFDLLVTSPITSGSVTSHIVTNGTGHLIYGAVTNATFPIGHDDTHYNPVRVTNAGGSSIYARVADGVVPAIAFPAYAINKTWYLHTGGAPVPSVTAIFQYNTSDVSAGITPHPTLMEVLQYIGAGWSVLPGNININPVGSDPYTVTTSNSLTINNVESPYALGKSGGLALAIDFFITATARKQGNDAVIKWKVGETDNILNFEIQRGGNGTAFQTIATVQPVTNQLEYSFTDLALSKGISLYRVKVNRRTGSERYSNTVAVINDSREVVINSITPNPVTGIGTLSISTGRATTAEFILTDMQGRLLRRWRESLGEGNNSIELDATALPAGAYQLSGVAGGLPVNSIRFIKQ